MIAYGKRTPERAERSHRKAEKQEEALKGLRKSRISYAAVDRGHPHTPDIEGEFAPAKGGELNENGVRLGVDFFTTLLQSVLFGIALPMASLGEAPRLAIGYRTTHRWCVTAGRTKRLSRSTGRRTRYGSVAFSGRRLE